MSEFDDLQGMLDDILNDAPVEKQPDKPPEPEPDTTLRASNAEIKIEDVVEAGKLDPEFDLVDALSSVMDDEPDKKEELIETVDAAKALEPEFDPLDALPSTPQGVVKAEPEVPDMPDLPVFCNEEIAAETDIRNFGTLATLQTARWHGKVKDNQAKRDAATAAGADSEAFEVRKNLLVGADAKLKAVHKAIDKARTKHYHMTLAWSAVSAQDSGKGKRTGGRLLPNTLFMEYTTEMGKAKIEMEEALADFVAVYPTLIQKAQQKLGTRFNPSEYPTTALIEAHFKLDFDFQPIPMAQDFKGLADAQVERLKGAMNRKTQAMLENAMQDAWSRLYKAVSHAYERFANVDKEFHYTLVDKLRDAAEMLKHLNVTNDPRIEAVRQHVESKLTMHEVKEIRKDDALRRHLADEAKAALDLMGDV